MLIKTFQTFFVIVLVICACHVRQLPAQSKNVSLTEIKNLVNSMDFSQAYKQTNEWISANPFSDRMEFALLLKADLLFKLQDFTKSKEVLFGMLREKEFKTYTDSVYYLLGENYLEEGYYDDAIEKFTIVYTKYPLSELAPKTILLSIDILLLIEDLDEAKRNINKYIELYFGAKDPMVYLYLTKYHFLRQEYIESHSKLIYLSELIKDNPQGNDFNQVFKMYYILLQKMLDFPYELVLKYQHDKNFDSLVGLFNDNGQTSPQEVLDIINQTNKYNRSVLVSQYIKYLFQNSQFGMIINLYNRIDGRFRKSSESYYLTALFETGNYEQILDHNHSENSNEKYYKYKALFKLDKLDEAKQIGSQLFVGELTNYEIIDLFDFAMLIERDNIERSISIYNYIIYDKYNLKIDDAYYRLIFIFNSYNRYQEVLNLSKTFLQTFKNSPYYYMVIDMYVKALVLNDYVENENKFISEYEFLPEDEKYFILSQMSLRKNLNDKVLYYANKITGKEFCVNKYNMLKVLSIIENQSNQLDITTNPNARNQQNISNELDFLYHIKNRSLEVVPDSYHLKNEFLKGVYDLFKSEVHSTRNNVYSYYYVDSLFYQTQINYYNQRIEDSNMKVFDKMFRNNYEHNISINNLDYYFILLYEKRILLYNSRFSITIKNMIYSSAPLAQERKYLSQVITYSNLESNIQEGRYFDALNYLNKMDILSFKDSLSLYNIYLRLGRKNEANKIYSHFRNTNYPMGQYSEGYEYILKQLFDLKDYASIRQIYLNLKSGIQFSESFVKISAFYIQSLYYLNILDEFVKEGNRFLNLYPDHSVTRQIRLLMGNYYYERNQYEFAMGQYSIIVSKNNIVDNLYQTSLFNLIIVSEKLSLFKSSLQYIVEYQFYFPNQKSALELNIKKGLLLRIMGNVIESNVIFRTVYNELVKYEDKLEVIFYYAESYFYIENYEMAIKYSDLLEQSSYKSSVDWKIPGRYLKALSYEKKGDIRVAIQQMEMLSNNKKIDKSYRDQAVREISRMKRLKL